MNNFANITNAPGNQRLPSLAYKNGCFHLIYSDASGAVFYQKGTISETNTVGNIFENNLQIKIISQPITNHEIIIQNNGEIIRDVKVELLNTAGQHIVQKSIGYIFPNQRYIFKMGHTIAGTYILRIISENKYWSKKIIIQ